MIPDQKLIVLSSILQCIAFLVSFWMLRCAQKDFQTMTVYCETAQDVAEKLNKKLDKRTEALCEYTQD